VSIITAKQLHQETKAVLNQLEQGESLVITRNGRTIGRIEPVAAAEQAAWPDIMAEVWRAQKRVKSSDRVPNPVLQERQRRRRWRFTMIRTWDFVHVAAAQHVRAEAFITYDAAQAELARAAGLTEVHLFKY